MATGDTSRLIRATLSKCSRVVVNQHVSRRPASNDGGGVVFAVVVDEQLVWSTMMKTPGE